MASLADPLPDDHDRAHEHEQGKHGVLQRHPEDRAEDERQQRGQQLQPGLVGPLRLDRNLDPARPAGRQQPGRPVECPPAVAGRGQVRVRLLRAVQREHVRPDLEQRARLPGPGRGQRLAVQQQRDASGRLRQRLDDGLPGRAAGPDREPGRIGGQPCPGHPDLAVGRGAQRERAESQPVHRPCGGPADQAHLGQAGLASQRGGRGRARVGRDQRTVPEHRSGAGPRVHRPSLQPQGFLGGGPSRILLPCGPSRGLLGGPRRGVSCPRDSGGLWPAADGGPWPAGTCVRGSAMTGASGSDSAASPRSAAATWPITALSSALTTRSCGPRGVSAVSAIRMPSPPRVPSLRDQRVTTCYPDRLVPARTMSRPAAPHRHAGTSRGRPTSARQREGSACDSDADSPSYRGPVAC